MFAVVEIGNAQYKIQEGDAIEVFRIDAEEDQEVNVDKVLIFADGSNVRIGQPYLKDVKVTAKVVKQVRGEKKIAFKFRRRENYARKVGHRQELTVLTITKISV